MTNWDISILTVPEDEDEEVDESEDDYEQEPPEPQWVDMNSLSALGMLNRKIWDAIDEAVEAQCKAEDAKRRKAAARAKRKK